jgi:hypothetical protein
MGAGGGPAQGEVIGPPGDLDARIPVCGVWGAPADLVHAAGRHGCGGAPSRNHGGREFCRGDAAGDEGVSAHPGELRRTTCFPGPCPLLEDPASAYGSLQGRDPDLLSRVIQELAWLLGSRRSRKSILEDCRRGEPLRVVITGSPTLPGIWPAVALLLSRGDGLSRTNGGSCSWTSSRGEPRLLGPIRAAEPDSPGIGPSGPSPAYAVLENAAGRQLSSLSGRRPNRMLVPSTASGRINR